MKNLILLIILLFTFSTTTYATTITGPGNIESYIIDNKTIPISKLRERTVSVFQVLPNGNYKIGAGISIDERHVLTVYHNVAENKIFIEEQGGNMAYSATITKIDIEHDLAILEISKNAPDMAKDKMTFGEPEGTLITIGHPSAKKNTMTTGKLSNLKSDQTALDMKVQPGNSGGGVINQKGELVGLIQSKLDAVENIAYMIGKDDIISFIGS